MSYIKDEKVSPLVTQLKLDKPLENNVWFKKARKKDNFILNWQLEKSIQSVSWKDEWIVDTMNAICFQMEEIYLL